MDSQLSHYIETHKIAMILQFSNLHLLLVQQNCAETKVNIWSAKVNSTLQLSIDVAV